MNKRRVIVPAVACAAWLLLGGAGWAQEAAQGPPSDPATAADTHGDDEHGADASHGDDAAGDTSHGDTTHGDTGHHEESVWVTLARVANFALLAGGLFYFLRAPIAAHLESRGHQIRADLSMAAQVRADATQRLADIERRMQELPGELELVRQRGVEEVAAEELRIAKQAEVERARLVAQARREIAQHAHTARQALTAHAASLVIGKAEARLRATLTADDQRRLADQFTDRIGSAQ